MTSNVIELDNEFSKLEFYGERTPESTSAELENAFALLSEYRDGGIFIGHYAGSSEWERHTKGDEIVYIVEGATRLVFLQKEEIIHEMTARMLMVVPRGIWHRFETLVGVKIMSVTPQPTDLSIEKPVNLV